MTTVFRAANKLLRAFEVFVLVVMLLLSVGAVTADVTLRALGIQGFHWLEEANTFYMALLTFVGSAVAVSSGGHLKVDMIYNALTKRTGLLVKSLTSLVCGGFMVIIFVCALRWTLVLRMMGTRTTSLGVPSYLLWILFTMSFFLILARFLLVSAEAMARYLHFEREGGGEKC